VTDLEGLLYGIDDKFSLASKNPANSGDSENEEHGRRKEIASIQQCLRICEEVSAHIDQLQAKDLADAPTFSNERPAPSPSAFKGYGGILEGSEDDDDEIASVGSVDSVGSTATGSSATLVSEALVAANEFVTLLLEDQSLAPLLSTAFERIKADKLERNFKRLLKVYAIGLQQEARGGIEKDAVQLILTHARYIAYRIRQRYDRSAPDNADRFERLTNQSTAKRALLEDYLRGRTRQSIETSLLGPDIDDDDDGDKSDSSAPSEAEADQLELNDLDRVKVFMVQSAAYHEFKQNLRDFILPRRESGQQESTSASSASFFYLDTWRRLQTKGVEAIHGLRMLSRPLVPPGHERITWICVRRIQYSRPQIIALTHFSLSRAVEIIDILIYVVTALTDHPNFKQFYVGPLRQRIQVAPVAAPQTPRGLQPNLIFQVTR
jgi:hypothetical protein